MDKTEFKYSETWTVIESWLSLYRRQLMDQMRFADSWDEHNKVAGQMDAIDMVANLPDILFKEDSHASGKRTTT